MHAHELPALPVGARGPAWDCERPEADIEHALRVAQGQAQSLGLALADARSAPGFAPRHVQLDAAVEALAAVHQVLASLTESNRGGVEVVPQGFLGDAP